MSLPIAPCERLGAAVVRGEIPRVRRLRDGASRFMRVHDIELYDGMTAAEKAAVRLAWRLAVTRRSWKHHAQRHMRCDGGVRRHGEFYCCGETKEGAGVFANA